MILVNSRSDKGLAKRSLNSNIVNSHASTSYPDEKYAKDKVNMTLFRPYTPFSPCIFDFLATAGTRVHRLDEILE